MTATRVWRMIEKRNPNEHAVLVEVLNDRGDDPFYWQMSIKNVGLVEEMQRSERWQDIEDKYNIEDEVRVRLDKNQVLGCLQEFKSRSYDELNFNSQTFTWELYQMLARFRS